MYVIIVYDIEQKRVAKVCKHLRKHLHWVQNSVFEGQLTAAQLQKCKMGLKKIINPKADSVLIYKLRTVAVMIRETMGIDKNPTEPFL